MADEHVEARAALLKFAALAVVIAVVLGAGTFLLVKALGLGGGGSGGGKAAAQSTSAPRQLPTVAITPSGGSSVSAEPSESPTPTPQGIQLAVNPAQPRPGERIYLTGQYPGADGVQLQVQREDAGTWAQFADVSLVVKGGAFSTYIITSRSGPTSFRLLDPTTGQASNPVQVTIG